MLEQKIIVRNKIGIHSRPATLLIDTAKKYKSEVTIAKGESAVGAKSLVRLLALKVKQDNEITLKVEGEDEAQAMAALVSLIESKFGED